MADIRDALRTLGDDLLPDVLREALDNDYPIYDGATAIARAINRTPGTVYGRKDEMAEAGAFVGEDGTPWAVPAQVLRDMGLLDDEWQPTTTAARRRRSKPTPETKRETEEEGEEQENPFTKYAAGDGTLAEMTNIYHTNTVLVEENDRLRALIASLEGAVEEWKDIAALWKEAAQGSSTTKP